MGSEEEDLEKFDFLPTWQDLDPAAVKAYQADHAEEIARTFPAVGRTQEVTE